MRVWSFELPVLQFTSVNFILTTPRREARDLKLEDDADEVSRTAGRRRHSCSLRLNTFCIIHVFLIPCGDPDSLWYSNSSACTAFGYPNVITMITGAESLYRMNGFHIHIMLSDAPAFNTISKHFPALLYDLSFPLAYHFFRKIFCHVWGSSRLCFYPFTRRNRRRSHRRWESSRR